MIYPHTPYEDWFNGRDEYPEIWIRDSVHRPSSLKDPARVLSEDRDAARLIDELENLIGSLRRYRRDLAARYNELSTMPYTYRRACTRNKSWTSKRVTYTIKLTRTYEDGTTVDEIEETFSGKDRKQALERFEELKKSRPGIPADLDLEKARWE